MISKRLIEIEIYKKAQAYFYMSDALNDKQIINHIDLQEFKNLLKKAIKSSKKDDDGFFVIYTKTLNYVVPIAYQGALNLCIDFDGNVINDVYNMDSKYQMQYLHVCVFPMQTSTFIVLYIDNGATRYRKFYKHFRQLNDTQKLNVISYIILLYSEDYYFNENLLKLVDSIKLKEIARSIPVYISNDEFEQTLKKLKNDFTLSKWVNCPNILSEEFALK